MSRAQQTTTDRLCVPRGESPLTRTRRDEPMTRKGHPLSHAVVAMTMAALLPTSIAIRQIFFSSARA
jgi:hypothetical protein